MNTKNNENLFIKKIILTNFRSHKELELNLDSLTVLIGENGAGKSSILEGICYGLFGTVASGAKKNELIKEGEKSGGVTLIFSNDYKLIRDFSSGVRLLDNENKIITEKVNEVESFLNIDKNVFMNILYAAQNDIYSYFIKFNAKEKDFIDSLFNLNNLTDKIAIFLKDSTTELLRHQNEIQSTINTTNNIQNNINNILNQYQLNDISELIHSVEIAKDNLSNFSQKQSLFNQRNQLLRDLEYKRGSIENLTIQLNQLQKMIDSSNLKIEDDKNKFKEYIDKLSKELNYDKIDINNLNRLYELMNNNININNHLNSIVNFAQQGLNNNDINLYKNIIHTVKIISMLDQYRSYYQKIKDSINQFQRNIEIDINTNQNNISNINIIKNNIQLYTKSLNDLNENINKINQEINDENLNEEFTNIAMKQQAQYSSLKTTLDNILAQQKSLELLKNKSENIDFNSIEKINNVINHIENITPIFSRDGFIQYLRKSLLKEIADNIGTSLEQFGFLNLLPVSINEKDGALTFHNKPFKSLSGGEKTITAILLRILYARLLLPSMRLNLLLLDEPTADLDSIRVGYLRQMLYKLNNMLNIQILVVTHDSEMIPDQATVININKNI